MKVRSSARPTLDQFSEKLFQMLEVYRDFLRTTDGGKVLKDFRKTLKVVETVLEKRNGSEAEKQAAAREFLIEFELTELEKVIFGSGRDDKLRKQLVDGTRIRGGNQ